MTTTVDETSSAPATMREQGHLTLTLGAAFLVSGALLALAEYLAVSGTSQVHFVVFWLAYALALAPIAWLLVRRTTSPGVLGALVVGLGVWGMVPKLVRTGHQIVYADEFAHYRMLEDLVRVGHPVSSFGLFQIGAYFPGLELVTAAFARISGVGLISAAICIIVVAHVALLAGVFVLVRDLSSSARAGAIAALVYSLNPSWLFFDAQFSYESLSLALLVWSLVFAHRATTRTTAVASTRYACIAMSLVLSVSIVITHHVTSVVNCLVLVAVAILASCRRETLEDGTRREAVGVAWGLAAFAVVVTALRFFSIGNRLWVYLGPNGTRFSSAFHDLLSLIGLSSSTSTRTVFGGSGIPIYEVICGYLMVPVLLVVFAWAVLGIARLRAAMSSYTWVLAGAGVLYFLSLPLLPTRQFSESVHRSWAYSFFGLAAIIGIAVARQLDGELTFSMFGRRWWPLAGLNVRRVGVIGALSLAVVAIGGVATGTTTVYRFGTPTVISSEDAAAIGTQTAMVASWFATNAKPGSVVFADRYVGQSIAIAAPVDFPAQGTLWGLTFDETWGPGLLKEAIAQGLDYVVVNRRMGNGHAPVQGYWYSPVEPHALDNYAVPERNVERYGCALWLNAVFTTTDYEVFAVNHEAVAHYAAQENGGIDPSCAARGIQ